jgi:hypothetical protein
MNLEDFNLHFKKGSVKMVLYTKKDLNDYVFLQDKFQKAVAGLDSYIEGKQSQNLVDDIENKFGLQNIKMIKNMMDELGIDVPDDKAKALGFEIL